MFYRSLRMGILVVHHSTFNPSKATGSNPKKVQLLFFRILLFKFKQYLLLLECEMKQN